MSNTIEIIAIVATVVGIIIGLPYFIEYLKKYFKVKDINKKFKRPKKTLKITKVDDSQFYWWSKCENWKNTSMSLKGVLKIENITDCEVYISSIFTKKPKFGGHFRVESSNSTIGFLRDNFVVEPTKPVRILFKIIVTPKKFIQKSSINFDIKISDQFGNEHLCKNVKFQYDQYKNFKGIFDSHRDLANL